MIGTSQRENTLFELKQNIQLSVAFLTGILSKSVLY